MVEVVFQLRKFIVPTCASVVKLPELQKDLVFCYVHEMNRARLDHAK